MGKPYIDIHTHKKVLSEDTVSVQSIFLQDADKVTSTLFTAGIHPWHADFFQIKEIMTMMEKIKGQENWIAVGEAGLDKKSKADFALQREVFELQLAFAEDNKMPIIIHNVKAWNEIISYKKKSAIPFIYHNYHGHLELTKQLLYMDGYFSFGASLLSENHSVKEALKIIPMDHLFFETDEANVDISEIYQCAADTLICPVNILKDQVFSNFIQIFKTTTLQSK